MNDHHTDKVFAGSIPECYETYLVPLIFQSYANDLALRLSAESVSSVLEIAAGTGVVTRTLADALPSKTEIIATDLNLPMLEFAAKQRTDHNVTWQQTDAQDLPFPNDSFDTVICQFGVMFFPDRTKAYAEARRVLKPGGHFIFSVWDKIQENEFADIITESLATLFPSDPPRFLARTPHGYANPELVLSDLVQAGFTSTPSIETLRKTSHALHPSIPAIAYCQGTPLRNEIESRNSELLFQATEVAGNALSAHFGPTEIYGKIQAKLFSVKA